VFVALVIFSLLSGGVGVSAYAATFLNGYSDVLDDLRKDENFNPDEYPAIDGDYSLQVFQIAESSAGELFVYVYQPAANVRELTATEIRLSQSIGENISPKDFKLTLLNRNGVFAKYKVEDLAVKTDTVRYYEIIQICRELFEGENNKTEGGNIIENVPCPVSLRFTACTLNNVVSYSCIVIDTLEIIPESKHVGYFQYFDGLGFISINNVDCWYVGFDTNKPIDYLQEAEISFKVRSVDTSYGFGIQTGQKFGEWQPFNNYVVKGEQKGSAGNGFLAKKYEWSRIYSFEDFKNNENFGLTDSEKENMNGCKWVLCFYETTRKKEGDYKVNHVLSSEVGDVTILRLKFETDGEPYNLGVVDNKQTVPPEQPPGGYGGGIDGDWDFWQWFADLLGVPVWAAKLIVSGVVILLLAGIILPILSAIFPVVGQVVKAVFYGVWWVISAPFRFIAWIIKKIRGDE